MDKEKRTYAEAIRRDTRMISSVKREMKLQMKNEIANENKFTDSVRRRSETRGKRT